MPRQHVQRRPVLVERLAADAEDGHAGDAYLAVRVEGHRPHVDERAGLDHGAAGTDEVERLDQALGEAGAAADDVGAEAGGGGAHGLDPLLAARP